MNRFINESGFRPESFLSHLPLWGWTINGYSVVMIIWNILLAALAVYLSYQLASALKAKRYHAGVPLALVWLLLVPNAAYIITDTRHIIGYCPIEEYGRVCQVNAWMTLFFFLYGAIGWLAFVYALRPVIAFLKDKWKLRVEAIAAPLCIVIALGVLMGLVNRWNSWEVVTDPAGILASTWRSLGDLTYLMNWLIMSVLLYILYLGGDRLFRPLGEKEPLWKRCLSFWKKTSWIPWKR